jgi:methylenetetrahydrofolate reductase (NADPH)
MTTPAVSFEVFPPRTVGAAFKLWDAAQALAPLAPRFFSVTYGAGGTTRDLTHDSAHVLHRRRAFDLRGGQPRGNHGRRR